MRERIDSALPDPPNRPYSQGIRTGDLVHVAGQVPTADDGTLVGPGDPAAQVHRVIDRIRTVVEAAGGTLDDVCKVTIYLADFEHFDAVNEAYGSRFDPPHPARTSVRAGMVRPEFLVEMDALAYVPPGRHTPTP